MTEAEAKEAEFSVFDLTKVWPHKKYPLRRFGKFTLNENPRTTLLKLNKLLSLQPTLFHTWNHLLIQSCNQDCSPMLILTDTDWVPTILKSQ